MNMIAKIASVAMMLTVAACGEPQQTDTNAVAEDFSARINGSNPASQSQTPQGSATPTVVPPRENAAEGAFAEGTATDPQSQTCNANKMGPFIGRPADEATRLEVMSAAAGASDVRFITPGSDYIRPDATNPRLNLMLDRDGIIRDARCG